MWFQIAERLRHAVENRQVRGRGDTLPSGGGAEASVRLSDVRRAQRAPRSGRGARYIRARSGRAQIVCAKRVAISGRAIVRIFEGCDRRGLRTRTGSEGSAANAATASDLPRRWRSGAARKVFISTASTARGRRDHRARPLNGWQPRLFRKQGHAHAEELETGGLTAGFGQKCGVTIGRANTYIESGRGGPASGEDPGRRRGFPLLSLRTPSAHGRQPIEHVDRELRSDATFSWRCGVARATGRRDQSARPRRSQTEHR